MGPRGRRAAVRRSNGGAGHFMAAKSEKYRGDAQVAAKSPCRGAARRSRGGATRLDSAGGWGWCAMNAHRDAVVPVGGQNCPLFGWLSMPIAGFPTLKEDVIQLKHDNAQEIRRGTNSVC